MTGREILDEVRVLINDPSYPRYNEINRAVQRISKLTNFNWLRETSEDLLSFNASESVYYLDMSNVRRLERLWVYGTASGQRYWHLMEEVDPYLYERHVKENIKPDGTNNQDRPKVFKIEGSPNAKITINPVPNTAYSVRVDYIRHIPKISPDEECLIPPAYHDAVADLAAGLILLRSADQFKLQYAQNLIFSAESQFDGLLRDSHPNRTIDIDRKETKWMK